MSNVIKGEAKVDVFYTCSKCGTENHPAITNQMVEENETINVECSNCGEINDIDTKELAQRIEKEALLAIKKEISNIFKKI